MRQTVSNRWSGSGLDRWTVRLVCLLWILSLADLCFTLFAHFFTPFYELNPAARLLLNTQMIPALVLAKLLLTTIGCTIFWRFRHRTFTICGLVGVVIVYVLLAIRWSDYMQTIAASNPEDLDPPIIAIADNS